MADAQEGQSLRDRIVAKLDATQAAPATWYRDELITRIVERHGPVWGTYLDDNAVTCEACSDPEDRRWTYYPCAELRMITQCMGVEIED